MPVTTTLDPKLSVIRLTGEIDMQVSLALLDEIKLLHDYYQFRDIELQIDSPGGSADALNHMLHSLVPWRKGEGRTLHTLGLNEIGSAAALLLSFGTVGHRRVSAHGRLLYHSLRIVNREASVQTTTQLRLASRSLDRWDKKFLDLLVAHVMPEDADRKSYRRKLQRLFHEERFITPKHAQELRLIDKVV